MLSHLQYGKWGLGTVVHSLPTAEKLDFLSNFSSFSSLLFQSKSWQKAKGMILKSCRVRYRDPLDKASEKQFIVNDDNGTHILGLELNVYVYKTLYIYAPPLPF